MSEDKIVVHVDSALEDLIPGFLENRQKDVHSMEKALQENDFETLRVVGHNVKGVGGGYGFPDMSEMGAAIEEGATENNVEKISKNVKKISHYLSNLEIIYDEE